MTNHYKKIIVVLIIASALFLILTNRSDLSESTDNTSITLALTNYFEIQSSRMNPKPAPVRQSKVTSSDKSFNKRSRNIFFIESTEPVSKLLSFSPRQACAIESVATHNPDSHIFIYLSGVVGVAYTPINNALWRVIQSLNNVHIKLINSTSFAENTPVEHLLQAGLNSKADWLKYHRSDILRFVLLWKYAGTYIDFDVISMMSLSGLGTNYAVVESKNKKGIIEAGAGIVNFDGSYTGRAMADFVLRELAVNFDGHQWSASSVGVLTRAIEHICGTRNISEMTSDRCQGFHLYPQQLIYAIHYEDFRQFLEERYFTEAMQRLNGSVGAHIWNFLSHDLKVRKNQRVALTEVARKNCPRVFATLPDDYF